MLMLVVLSLVLTVVVLTLRVMMDASPSSSSRAGTWSGTFRRYLMKSADVNVDAVVF